MTIRALVCALAGLAALAGLVPVHARAQAPFGAPLQPAARTTIRDVADGAGPSQVFAMGKYILVVDPWNFEVRRYLASDIAKQPRICLYPRSFAPGRIVREAGRVRLIAEPYGPDGKGGYDLRERQAMTITAREVDAMPIVGPCRFDIGAVRPDTDTPPRIHTGQGSATGASWPLSGAARARITPQAGPGSRVFAVRFAGKLSRGRTLLWWSEVGGDDGQGASSHAIAPMTGRLVVSQYVGVFGPGGGAPGRIVRIDIADIPPLLADHGIPVISRMEKPGLEYIAAGHGPRGDAVWIAASRRVGPGRGRFELQRYDLVDMGQAKRADIALVKPAHSTQPLLDREDRAPGEQPEEADVAALHAMPVATYAQAVKTLKAQISYRWRVPQAMRTRPCEGRDKCRIGADANGVLGHGPEYGHGVRDGSDPDGGAYWVQPRQLVGLLPGAQVRSIPYSIGGQDLAGSFARRLAAGYGKDSATAPPIGHIGEGLEWHHPGQNPQWREDKVHYPLGIDCSALIARVNNLRIRSTGAMVRSSALKGADGHIYEVPVGPDHACPAPVASISRLRPGDILLRNGHVVIFDGFTTVAGAPGRSRAMRVFEATSRCGAVCESVYDPTYFAGWWMLRLSRGKDGSNCPFWQNLADARERALVENRTALPEDQH